MNIAHHMRGPLGQKTPPLVSTKIRASAKGESCTLRLPCCNGDNETTVFCHLRFFGWAGIAQKPDDLLGVYGCSACHDALDGRSNGLWGFEDVLRALGETLMKLKAKGLVGTK